MEDRSKTVLRVSHAHRHNTMPLVHKMSHCIGQICTDTVSLLWRNAKSSHRTMPRLVNHPSHQYDADHAPSSFRLMQVPGYTLLTLCEGIIGYSCCLLDPLMERIRHDTKCIVLSELPHPYQVVRYPPLLLLWCDTRGRSFMITVSDLEYTRT